MKHFILYRQNLAVLPSTDLPTDTTRNYSVLTQDFTVTARKTLTPLQVIGETSLTCCTPPASPIALVGETLKHAGLCKCRGVLLVPEWKSAYFWPLLIPDGVDFFPFVHDYLVLDPYFINQWRNTSVVYGFAKFR